MKVVKGILFFIVFIIMAGCAGVLVCAFNPSLTAKLAERVEDMAPAPPGGLQGVAGAEGDSQGGAGGADSWQQIIPGGTGEEEPEVRPGINVGWMEEGDGVSYEAPDGQPEEIPDSVSGRGGYESVKEEAEQIAQEEADDLSQSIAVGETGSELGFDEEYYPYYAMLEEDMRQLYSQIYANALKLTESLAPIVPVSVGQLKTVFEAVYNDHPELFWLESGYSCKYLRSGKCVEIILKYNAAAENLEEARQSFEAAAERILSAARDLEDGDYEKYVHDALVQSVEYDMGAAMNQSAYSALVEGRSVCAGYARAFQYLMQQLGIPCYYCTGYAGEDHAWNIVKAEDGYYNVDVTWDDTDVSAYDYFMKSDKDFAATHRRTGLSVYLPACVADAGAGEDADDAAQDSGDGGYGGEVSSGNAGQGAEDSPDGGGNSGEDDGEEGEDSPVDAKTQDNLAKAGITQEEVRGTMEEYYADCLELLTGVGAGDKQFSNVIPESLWAAVEQAYNSGAYWEGYAEEALEALGVENLTIQLQAQRLGGGYYRLYHNVYTY